MKKLFIIAVALIATAYVVAMVTDHGQHHGGGHNQHFPDSLAIVEVSGIVSIEVDTAICDRAKYFLDVDGNGEVDYKLGLGPWWYQPDSGATRPNDGDSVTIVGGLIDWLVPMEIVVFEINGEIWRDTSGTPPWGGGWLHRNGHHGNDTTRVHCPHDSTTVMGFGGNCFRWGMPDSIFCNFNEMDFDSLNMHTNGLGVYGFNMFMTDENGNSVMQGHRLQFNSQVRQQFHVPSELLNDKSLTDLRLYVRDEYENLVEVQGIEYLTSINAIAFSSSDVYEDYYFVGSSVTNVDNEITPASEFTLAQNFPNPFNPTTSITFSIANNSHVILSVYNVSGELVSTLVNGTMSAGAHSVEFNASNLPSGMYFYRLSADGMTSVKKMVLLK